MNYRLGLDVGTNSLGWSVLELDKGNNPCRIEAAGVRIFSDGRNPKDRATLKAERRMARSARRRRDRFKQRQAYLLSELTKCSLFPVDEQEKKKLQLLNPIELRAKALTEKLPLHHIGRALFHLNQRRGFKSNRKDTSEEKTSGKVSTSVRQLLEQMELIGAPLSKDEYRELSHEEKKKARQQEAIERQRAYEKLTENNEVTYGAFLWARQKSGKPTRARPASDGKSYDIYPDRQLIEDEFDKIWNSQSQYYPEVFDKISREKIHGIIFHQRSLKIPARGRCAYLSEEIRTFRAMPTFQRYRIYQEVNNLEWATSDGKSFLKEHREARDQIVAMLESPKNKDGRVSFQAMKKCLRKSGLAEGDFRFTFETPKRKGFDGNLTSHAMQHEDRIGQAWHEWSLEKQDEFVAAILDDNLEDEEVCDHLIAEYGLTRTVASNCMNASLVEGTANLSLQAARLLLEKMRDELMIQSKAVQSVAAERDEFINPFTRSSDRELLPLLPYYGKVFHDGRHIILGSRDEKDKGDDLKFYGGVTNPTVHIALNQIRHVVNELIKRYGHPTSIAIELGRELPVGKEGRREIEEQQAKNQEDNERLDGELEKLGIATTYSDNRLRLKLWEELGEDPVDRCCPYSGKQINVADLFTDRVEIDHVIPFSRSLDDGRVNKVICTRQANRDKGKRTPFEAFGSSPGKYNWHQIFERAKKLGEFSPGKLERFSEDAAEKFGGGVGDFTDRHLNDTRYIGRFAKEYLEYVCPHQKIDVCTGRLTYLLRKYWGLNSALHHSSNDRSKKNRDDHRHHAVDAIVVGMTTRSILQRVSTEANRAEDLGLGRLFDRGENGKTPIDPWDGFRNEVIAVAQDIVVSHKARRKKLTLGVTDGQLHNETAYSIKSGPDKKGYYEVAWRRPIEELAKDRKYLEAVVDTRLRAEVIKIFDESGKDGVISWAEKRRIRRLRCKKNLKVIPIKNSSAHAYKAYKGDSNWGIEIYESPSANSDAPRWEGFVITRFRANQKDFRFGHTCKPHPTARLVMRLQVNDCVEMQYRDEVCVMRLQKLNQDGAMFFAPHNEANVARRNSDDDDSFTYFRRTANTLRDVNARKAHISPTGLVSYEARSGNIA